MGGEGGQDVAAFLMTQENGSSGISWLDWIRYGPFLAQLIVTRRCNLSCGYCTEYDKTSEFIPFETLSRRLKKLRELRTWALSLMGGEPTLHPDLFKIISEMKSLGFRRRMMTTNGFLLTKDMIEGLNENGLTDMSLSVDGAKQSNVTIKVLDTLRKKIELLAKFARFDVVLSAVIGSSPGEEVLDVVHFARSHNFNPRILLIHDENGQIKLNPEQLAVYSEVQKILGKHVTKEDGGYRERLIETGEAPFRCRSGSRYLYVDEFGMARWCAQTRTSYGKNLMDYSMDDLRKNFYEGKSCSSRCSVGCVRTASAYDQWRPQNTPLPNPPPQGGRE